MNLRALSLLTATPERQIRYMIAEGFVPSPRGGRANADYGDDHVTAIRRYGVLRQQGLPPQAIRVLLASGMAAPFPVADGVTLHVDPRLLGRAMDVDALSQRLRSVLSELFMEPSDAPARPDQTGDQHTRDCGPGHGPQWPDGRPSPRPARRDKL